MDNDVLRFPISVLRQWKTEAESDAKNRLGKTATVSNSSNDASAGRCMTKSVSHPLCRESTNNRTSISRRTQARFTSLKSRILSAL